MNSDDPGATKTFRRRVARLVREIERGMPNSMIATELILIQDAMWVLDRDEMAWAHAQHCSRIARAGAGLCLEDGCQRAAGPGGFCEACDKALDAIEREALRDEPGNPEPATDVCRVCRSADVAR